MAIKQEVIIDSIRRRLIINTELPQTDVQAAYNPAEFMQQVHCEIALKIADQVYKQIAPAIDEAMKNIQFTEVVSDNQ